METKLQKQKKKLYCIFSPPEDFIAVPIMSILETTDFHNLQPAAACLLVLACSCAFLELFPEMYNLIVALTTADWKILSRQIGYENGDTGSPVLAIFTGGSICAMIAFACPMEFIIYLIAGSQLSASIIRAFYLFYSPFRPNCLVTNQSECDLWLAASSSTIQSNRMPFFLSSLKFKTIHRYRTVA